MQINDVVFNTELIDIVHELQVQLQLNNIHLLGKIKDTVNNVQVCCPYHKDGQERKPSAGIHKETGVFHCFSCQETHSLQEVISFCFGHYDDIVGTFGWQWLLKNFATVEVEERKDVKLDFSRNNFSNSNSYNNNSLVGRNRRNNSSDYSFISEQELDSYRYIHPYMYERKLTDEIIELFDLGYDAATESITFPIKDINGNCLFIARRSVNSKFFSYPAGVEKPLYGLYEYERVRSQLAKEMMFMRSPTLKFMNEIIVCESMLDALTCWVYGRPAVALNGLGNELAIKQLNELSCRKVILATDKDEAGKQARIKLRKLIKNKLITEFDYSSYPAHAKDINDMSKEEFDSLIEVF